MQQWQSFSGCTWLFQAADGMDQFLHDKKYSKISGMFAIKQFDKYKKRIRNKNKQRIHYCEDKNQVLVTQGVISLCPMH